MDGFFQYSAIQPTSRAPCSISPRTCSKDLAPNCLLGPSAWISARSSLVKLRQARDENGAAALDDEDQDMDEEEGVEAMGAAGQAPMNRKERRRANKKERARTRTRRTPEDNKESERVNAATSHHTLVDPDTIDRLCASLRDESPDGKCVVEIGSGV